MNRQYIKTVRGTKLAYFAENNPYNSSHIVFVHGFPMDHRIWNLIPPLGRTDIRVDLSGFGDSEIINSDGAMESYADGLINLMDALDVPKAIFCAHSMGGYVCLELLSKYPERVDGMVLAGSQTAADSFEKKIDREGMIGRLRSDGIKAVMGMAEILSADKVHTHFFERMIQEQEPEGAIFAVQAMIARSDHTDTLFSAGIPKLIVHGEQDTLVPIENYGDVLIDSGTEVIQLPGIGHSPMLEAPQEFARILNNWMTRNFS